MDILIVEDDDLVGAAWRRVLTLDGWRVARARTLLQAEALLADERYACQVALLDLQLPDGDGLELLPLVDRYAPSLALVIVSATYHNQHAIRSLGRCEAVLHKPVEPEALRSVVKSLATMATRRDCVEAFAARHSLSPTEADVLHHAVAGMDNNEIAAALGCARGSVTTYWKRIFEKTATNSQRGVLALLLRTMTRMGVRLPTVTARG